MRAFNACTDRNSGRLYSGGSSVIFLLLALPDRILELAVALSKPARHRHLLLSIELDALFALDVQIAEE